MTPPPPDSLTTWFLDAKRSLNSVSLCTRAHVLVDSARAALQEASIVASRCGFLRTALQEQLTIADQINRMVHTTKDGAREEFEKTLTDLDNADIRLNQTLELLRNSVVDPAFTVSGSSNAQAQAQPQQRKVKRRDREETEQEEQEEQEQDGDGDGDKKEQGESDYGGGSESSIATARMRTLHDFVEDGGIENLKTRLRHSIDYVQESHDALSSSIGMFDESLQSLSSSLSSLADPTPHTEPLHPPLHALEEHTEAMASLLESLTQHYDRCSQALKATESGTSVDPDLMLVLSRDAAEVDDVVHELKERLAEMETIYYSISSSIEELRRLERDTVAVFAAFEEFQTELAICMDGLREFEMRQAELKLDMQSRLSELWELGEFYEGFVGAYDAMVVEVGRRKGLAVRMEAVVKEAQKKLRALYDEDMQDREIFTEEYGQWLPVDLWPGFRDPPARWVIEKDLQGGTELPKLGKDVIERALRRRTPVP
ncbi:autophagy protein Apg17-domain-containing protein [Tricharina praecox]|uniref:autophagy protein Apg17-domain-containing protein n=1 Tax=Tricharina praecox TaxID=43433 RepID=UPI002220C0B7|nr:autophagy protein Apg17-domain-containing protein [Tricharina praecox]KAI5843236.1 autophagy protein Apg17-domain-containing protein [Tricharina praecox]